MQATTQEIKPSPPFETELGLGGSCAELSILSNWTVVQPEAVSIEYTLVDLTTGSVFPYTTFFSAGSTTVITTLGFLQAIPKGAHRFRIDSQMLRADSSVIFKDSDKDRFPCELPAF